MRTWLGCLAVLGAAMTAGAAELSGYSVVKIPYGVTNADWTGDGGNDVSVLGRRENFNAHGFDVLTLYVSGSLSEGAEPVLNLVPLFDGEKERFEVTVAGGADCVLHDFRLLRGQKANDVLLVLADREPGESFAAEAEVKFATYALRVNQAHDVGRPLVYFEKTGTSVAKKHYCDVEEAFTSELGLADYRARND
jgi:carbapenem resistance CarG-like protein